MILEINGGTKTQRRLTEACVKHAIEELMPRMKKLFIEVNIVDIKSDATGFCTTGDTNRDIEIEVDKKLGMFAMASTILHEMVHAKQYARKEIDGINFRWNGEDLDPDTLYKDLPWEQEAYRMQDELLIKMVDKNLF